MKAGAAQWRCFLPILDDVRKRHPGEELYYYYPYMRALDEAIQS